MIYIYMIWIRSCGWHLYRLELTIRAMTSLQRIVSEQIIWKELDAKPTRLFNGIQTLRSGFTAF